MADNHTISYKLSCMSYINLQNCIQLLWTLICCPILRFNRGISVKPKTHTSLMV